MTNTARIHWLNILIGGFLAEASVFAVVIPVFMASGARGVLYAAPVASLVMCFIFGLVVARRVGSRPFCMECWSELLPRSCMWP